MRHIHTEQPQRSLSYQRRTSSRTKNDDTKTRCCRVLTSNEQQNQFLRPISSPRSLNENTQCRCRVTINYGCAIFVARLTHFTEVSVPGHVCSYTREVHEKPTTTARSRGTEEGFFSTDVFYNGCNIFLD